MITFHDMHLRVLHSGLFRLGAFILLMLTIACVPEDTAMDLQDAYSEVGSVIDYKREECGQTPAYPLLLPARPSAYGIRLCTLTILRDGCPFQDYPLVCFEIYSEVCEVCDLPLIGP